jgi:hypothetical protein
VSHDDVLFGFRLRLPRLRPQADQREARAREVRWLRISANGIWRCLRRHGLNTRTRRLSLVVGYPARYERKPPAPRSGRHVEASRPGERVGLDRFYVGCLSGTKGRAPARHEIGEIPKLPAVSATGARSQDAEHPATAAAQG